MLTARAVNRAVNAKSSAYFSGFSSVNPKLCPTMTLENQNMPTQTPPPTRWFTVTSLLLHSAIVIAQFSSVTKCTRHALPSHPTCSISGATAAVNRK
ncbi:MAG: hypothetical protein BWY99_01328 [Synergistetes bacterium ADurb.BinA166]|nr:MAG: hypothetical protein BWY99_01328 [Synergistetes bacterium ADurb.BinA166]